MPPAEKADSARREDRGVRNDKRRIKRREQGCQRSQMASSQRGQGRNLSYSRG